LGVKGGGRGEKWPKQCMHIWINFKKRRLRNKSMQLQPSDFWQTSQRHLWEKDIYVTHGVPYMRRQSTSLSLPLV
jgi:hypothetical protein